MHLGEKTGPSAESNVSALLTAIEAPSNLAKMLIMKRMT